MNLERWIIVGIIILNILLIGLFLPKEKAREAWLLFLSLQFITWPAGLFAVEMGWINYPVQLLIDANKYNKTSFSFEFLFFPILSVFFSLYFPKNKNITVKFLYYSIFASVFTTIEVILEKTTNLVHYDEWKWHWSLISIIISLFINHHYYLWFIKRLKKVGHQ
ncbi:CBO0543 family protein [Fredinandcohnia quinoae]|uniref:Rod shape-determining protein MreD n=1 Tax=Fredinandcohnia quinoae TaxID=2918902 RepID=A0AAW5EDH6_9BACI|nr:CBO0543 family protein [Fredinandcohnia sp. SECRCQ15]MCH1627198.1 hypothetical protein [Fredinandcohnia sp. SECRCQ15]